MSHQHFQLDRSLRYNQEEGSQRNEGAWDLPDSRVDVRSGYIVCHASQVAGAAPQWAGRVPPPSIATRQKEKHGRRGRA